MSESSLFSLTPERLIFNLDTDNISELSSNTSRISKEIQIKIINISDNFAAIKIKTTKKKNYIMSPSSEFILEPKEEKEINIRFKRDENEKLKLKSHKVQFEGIAIKEIDKDLSIKDLFDKYTKSENKVDIITKQIETEFFDRNGNNLLSMSNSNISKTSTLNNTYINTNNDINDDINVIQNNDMNLIDLRKASDSNIIIALALALFIGLFILN
jgi:hypothetical protein